MELQNKRNQILAALIQLHQFYSKIDEEITRQSIQLLINLLNSNLPIQEFETVPELERIAVYLEDEHKIDFDEFLIQWNFEANQIFQI